MKNVIGALLVWTLFASTLPSSEASRNFDSSSPKATIDGAVSNGGIFTIEQNETIWSLIQKAGGLDPMAKDTVRVTRHHPNHTEVFIYPYDKTPYRHKVSRSHYFSKIVILPFDEVFIPYQ